MWSTTSALRKSKRSEVKDWCSLNNRKFEGRGSNEREIEFTAEEMADPLSFFAGEDSSDSDGEGEPEPEKQPERVEEDSRPDKLPSPDTLFATVGRPSFLSTSLNPSGRREVNWDRFVKNDTEENIHADGTHAAIAPPSDLENSRGNISSSLSIAIASTYTTPSHEISAAPVKYSKPRTVDDDEEEEANVGVSGAAMTNHGEGKSQSVSAVVAGTKRSSVSVKEGEDGGSGDGGGDGSAKKKSKTETFRQKEKRKRDVGQSSRGKSYVEEEKRILRQAFATDEVMS